ncbi:hypothetical protein HMN09_00472000 [Mycena chlorophos]|uniref:F-box domain-containing protein n=1 Tax=Mycena chlorophos TaxID=658473 RepID=A0A8H6WH17_MYCCL|nr:hypothetical protein HMN09_00472000 [Mycena chlorophos]
MAPRKTRSRAKRAPKKAPHSTSAPPRTSFLALPPEICSVICEYLHPTTLVPLCGLSRAFRGEAQRAVFRTVDLRDAPSAALKQWFTVVNAKPWFASYIESLSVRLPPPEKFVLSPDAQKLAKAIEKCTKLTELAVHVETPSNSFKKAATGIQTWLISSRNTKFRLKTFANSYLRNDLLGAFWRNQPEIRILSLVGQNEPIRLWDDVLPQLVGLEVSHARALPLTPRPLQRIQIMLWTFARDLPPVERFADTLTTLNLLDIDVWTSLPGILDFVAHGLPQLTHLGLAERFWDLQYSPDMFHQESTDTPKMILKESLPRLESFILHTYRIHTMYDDRGGGDIRRYAFRGPDSGANMTALEDATLSLLSKHPALRRAEMGALDLSACPKVLAYEAVVRRKAEFEMVCACWRDTVPGVVYLESGTGFNFRRASGFWEV